jgi:hypothetical protein
MFDEIAKITQKYIGEGSDAAFARSLGLPTFKRQHVFNWRRGKQTPDMMTLIKVMGSETATPEAKRWAGEVLSIKLQEGK